MVHIIQMVLGHDFNVPKDRKINLPALAGNLSKKGYKVSITESGNSFLHCNCFDSDLCIPFSGKVNIRTKSWIGMEHELEAQLNNFYKSEIRPFLITNGVKLRKSRTRKR